LGIFVEPTDTPGLDVDFASLIALIRDTYRDTRRRA
jgi:hypothetical protein